MPERYEFQRELDVLHKDLTKMGAVIEQSMTNMIEALVTQNTELAQAVIDNDHEINQMEHTIEKECILLIARQQPIASDLRDIAAVLKIVTDLERIADHCADICKYILNLSNQSYVKPIVHIPEMITKVKEMVKWAIDCTLTRDLELAQKIVLQDDEVDQYFYTIIDELVEVMTQNPETIRQCKDFMFIVKYLERMGDHATNIAEWVYYIVTGKHRKNIV